MSTQDEMCFLLPYTKEDIFTFQADNQYLGWHISSFNLDKVWQLTQGEGVTVAVIDSGCDLTHIDLKDNLVEGKNFVEPNLPPTDSGIHGTHVSGIIAACNNETGIVGIAPKCKIMPLKVLNSFGMGSMDHVTAAIYYAVDNGADIITMSLGARNPVDKLKDAIVYANSKLVTCFVAAGNAGSSKQLLYPAAYTECISIGAVDENSMRADFSCTGPNLDFVAPGVKIYSTVPTNSYSFLSGTSMSCPFAVGTAALVLSQRREVDPTTKIGIEEYREILRSHTIDIKNLDISLDQQGKRFWQGMGIINPSQFEEWVQYRNSEEIKKDILRIKDQISLIKNLKLKEDIKKFIELIYQNKS
jgi:subtilisin family serine protease